MAGNANDVRAGGAWYELWGKDKLTPILDQAKKNAESFGGAMKNLGKRAGGGLDAVLGGIKGKAIELGVQLVTSVGRAIVELVANVETLRKEFEKTARVISQLDAMTERNMAARSELIEAEIDPKKKVLAIDKEIARIEQERATLEVQKAYHEDKKDRLGTFKRKGTAGERATAALTQIGGAIGLPGLEDSVADHQQYIDQANAQRDKLFARLQDLSAQRGKLMNPDRDPEKIKATAELTRELKKQAETFQQAADKVKLYELELENYSKTQIAAVAEAQQRVKLQETLGGAAAELAGSIASTGKDITKEVKDTTDALKEQLATWGMLPEQAEVQRLRLKGVKEEAVQTAQKLADEITTLNALAGAAGELFNSTSGKAKELAEEVEAVTKALKEQADTWGLAAEDMEIYKLRAKGVREEALEAAKKEAGRVKLQNFLGGAADAIANGVTSAEKLTLTSPGSFTAGNAAQRFGADTIPVKALRAAEQTAKNTSNMVKAVAELAKGLRFQ